MLPRAIGACLIALGLLAPAMSSRAEHAHLPGMAGRPHGHVGPTRALAHDASISATMAADQTLAVVLPAAPFLAWPPALAQRLDPSRAPYSNLSLPPPEWPPRRMAALER